MNCINCNSTKVLLIETYFASITHIKDPDTNEVLDILTDDLELREEHYQCNNCDRWYQLDENGKMIIHHNRKND